MQQLLSVWFSIDGRKRAIVALSAIAMFAAVIGLSRFATAPSLVLLYSNIDARSAGEIVNGLEQRGVAFEVRGNSIFVDSQDRDQLRMTLASEGLPANNEQGYELLDTLSGFGTTAQMFDAAYWRAKEGELARTIVASPKFSEARVHISNSSSTPFRRAISPTASVTVTGTSGAIAGPHAKALKYLVSSAVAGMTPADVAIIDGRNGVVVQDESQELIASNGTDRALVLKQNIERILEARVGPGKAIVEVFVEITNEREAITERTFDPNSRVIISTQKEERTTSSNDSRAGSVTVASNLPEGDGSAENNNSSSQNTESNESTNYEVSETTRELLRNPGSILRISIAVLVDGVLETNPDTNTETWTARSEEELTTLRDLVSSAVGFNADRGDTITLKSLQFQTPETLGSVAQVSLLQKLNLDVMRLVQVFVLAVIVLILGLFVLRPILTKAPIHGLPGPNEFAGLPNLTNETNNTAAPALTGDIDDRQNLPPGLSVIPSEIPRQDGTQQLSLAADPVERLRTMIADRQDETVEILRTWIDGKEEHV